MLKPPPHRQERTTANVTPLSWNAATRGTMAARETARAMPPPARLILNRRTAAARLSIKLKKAMASEAPTSGGRR